MRPDRAIGRTRRQFIGEASRVATRAGLAGLGSWSVPRIAAGAAAPRILVVGGGFAGATAAKYLRQWSDYQLDVTLIEANTRFVSCPVSNQVIGGTRAMTDITHSYASLERRHGVRRLVQSVSRIDTNSRHVQLVDGSKLGYDRLVLAPGVELVYDSLPGLRDAGARSRVLHAWKAGEQTLALREQLRAMPDGGVFAITIPLMPYRCPPGPYERACQVAAYFKREKPAAKVLVLDANADITAKGKLFKAAWADHFGSMIEYRPQHTLVDVDARDKRLIFEFEDPLKADVLNVLPPMRAGALAVQTGLASVNARWCPVRFLNFESTVASGVHVLGDSIQPAPGMPKSGHMANQQAKVCASAIIAELADREFNAQPMLSNTCYSFVNETDAVHVASVHAYDAAGQTFLSVPGAGGLSLRASTREASIARAWARNIWSDMLD